MKLWMLIMIGWYIYRALVPKIYKTVEPNRPTVGTEINTTEHTTLVTYSSARAHNTDSHKRPLEIAQPKKKGIFTSKFISDNTQETQYIEI